MFEPSFILLIAKIIAIFSISWITGWSLCWNNSLKDKWVSWVLLSVTGAAALNLSIASAIMWGLPGWSGLFLIALMLGINVIRQRQTLKKPRLTLNTLWTSGLLLCLFTATNYLAPFIVEGTSGLYSRGGGDHSTYLGFSDYFQHGNIWEPIGPEATKPPNPNEDINTYRKTAQEYLTKEVPLYNFSSVKRLPIGNQVIATPYMVLLPGEPDETYSATVTFYVVMVMATTIALIRLLFSLGPWTKTTWLAFIPLTLSNLMLYPSGTQSIPYLLGISLFNLCILQIWCLTREPLTKGVSNYLPLMICGGGLLTIYPFLFFALLAVIGGFGIFSFNREKFLRFLSLSLILIAGSSILTHLYLLLSLPLVWGGATMGTTLYPSFSIKEIIATQSGFFDFLSLTGSQGVYPYLTAGMIAFFFSLAFAIVGLLKSQKKREELSILLILVSVFWIGMLFYGVKETGGYQMVRFATIAHLYTLGLMGLGLHFMLKALGWQRVFASAVILVFAGFSINIRADLVKTITGNPHSFLDSALASAMDFAGFSIDIRSDLVKTITGNPHSFGTEMRDADAYRIRSRLKNIQETETTSKQNRIVYYFGHGDGTDFGGSTVFLRNLYSLDAMNIENAIRATYEDSTSDHPSKPPKLWDKGWLNGALLMANPVQQFEIIQDNRANTPEPLISSDRTVVWDTTSGNIAAVIGQSWNYPIPYGVIDGQQLSFRYLRGLKGAISIWSEEAKRARMKITLASDALESQLLFLDNQSGLSKQIPIELWKADYTKATSYEVDLDLQPGSNTFELTPLRPSQPNPWFLVLRIIIEDIIE